MNKVTFDHESWVQSLHAGQTLSRLFSSISSLCWPDDTCEAQRQQQQKQRQQPPMVIITPITIPAMTPLLL